MARTFASHGDDEPGGAFFSCRSWGVGRIEEVEERRPTRGRQRRQLVGQVGEKERQEGGCPQRSARTEYCSQQQQQPETLTPFANIDACLRNNFEK